MCRGLVMMSVPLDEALPVLKTEPGPGAPPNR
jgi:hypothetical protein